MAAAAVRAATRARAVALLTAAVLLVSLVPRTVVAEPRDFIESGLLDNLPPGTSYQLDTTVDDSYVLLAGVNSTYTFDGNSTLNMPHWTAKHMLFHKAFPILLADGGFPLISGVRNGSGRAVVVRYPLQLSHRA